MRAFCLDRGEEREFAIKDMSQPPAPAEAWSGAFDEEKAQ
jgi:hypothetical protein